ncbi:hypothetical protein V6N13_072932 [Hibiscus sabdariffa]
MGDLETRVIETSTENFERVCDVNVLGAFHGAKHDARVMVSAKKGCILFAARLALKICYGNSHAYKTSKHVVAGLTKSLVVELGEHGIKVNCISPHGIFTLMFQKTLVFFDKRRARR